MRKIIKLSVKAADRRNELHFEVQRKTRAQVFADRRRKKPKYPLRAADEW